MDGSLRIGRLFGIPIELHWTFVLVIPLFAWIIGTQIALTTSLLSEVFGVAIDTSLITGRYMPYLLGAAVSLGLFAGVLIHEVAHSVVALRKGMKINAITLFLFGGVSQMEESTPDPRIELPMALVGPVTSPRPRHDLHRARLRGRRRDREPRDRRARRLLPGLPAGS